MAFTSLSRGGGGGGEVRLQLLLSSVDLYRCRGVRLNNGIAQDYNYDQSIHLCLVL